MIVGIVTNPKAGLGFSCQCHRAIVSFLEKHKFRFIHAYIESKEDVDKVFNIFLENSVDILLVVGGDGTLNYVADKLIRYKIPIVAMPGGSGNDFSKTHWNIENIERFLTKLLRRGWKEKLVDTGKLKGENMERIFVNSMGVGTPGMVAYRAYISRKRRGFVEYLKGALHTLIHAPSFKCRMLLDGKLFMEVIHGLHVGINVREGGGFPTFVHAKPDDGLLDVLYLRRTNKIRMLIKLYQLLKGKHVDGKLVRYFQVSDMEFEIYEDVIAHVDGEYFFLKAGSYSVEILPESLKIALP